MNRRIKIEAEWTDSGVKFDADCMIGQYDGVSEDDDIFYWFADENDVRANVLGSDNFVSSEFIIRKWWYV